MNNYKLNNEISRLITLCSKDMGSKLSIDMVKLEVKRDIDLNFKEIARGFSLLLKYMNELGFYLSIRQSDIDCLGEKNDGVWVACFFYNDYKFGVKKMSGPWAGSNKSLEKATIKAAIVALDWLNDK